MRTKCNIQMMYYKIVHLKHNLTDQCHPNKFNQKERKKERKEESNE